MLCRIRRVCCFSNLFCAVLFCFVPFCFVSTSLCSSAALQPASVWLGLAAKFTLRSTWFEWSLADFVSIVDLIFIPCARENLKTESNHPSSSIHTLHNRLSSDPSIRQSSPQIPYTGRPDLRTASTWQRKTPTTDNLAVSAQGFRRGANRVRKQMWWKDMKMRIIIGVGIAVLIIIIVVPVVKAWVVFVCFLSLLYFLNLSDVAEVWIGLIVTRSLMADLRWHELMKIQDPKQVIFPRPLINVTLPTYPIPNSHPTPRPDCFCFHSSCSCSWFPILYFALLISLFFSSFPALKVLG